MRWSILQSINIYIYIYFKVTSTATNKNNQTGKTTAIKRIAVRETIASLCIIGPQLKAPLKPLGPSQHYDIWEFRGTFNWAPFLPKDTSLSDSRCKFFQSENTNDKRVQTQLGLWKFQTGKTTTITRIAIRETSVCGIMGVKLRAPLNTSDYHSTIVLRS